MLVSRSRQSLHAKQWSVVFSLGIFFSLPLLVLCDESHASCGLGFVKVGTSEVSQGLTLRAQSFASLALAQALGHL